MIESISYFKSIHNIHKGRRGFVIGNGPSLLLNDLDLLIDEVTIASNKIYLAFDSVKWRPTYYTVADSLLWGKIKNIIPSHFKKVHIPNYLKQRSPCHLGIDCAVWDFIGLAGGRLDTSNNQIDFSSDATKGFYGGCTVTFDNLQLAVHLGLNPIYIIGCDHYYKGLAEADGPAEQSTVCDRESISNHFINSYHSIGEKVNMPPIKFINRSYLEARKFSEKHGIKILNATRGGYLDIFERVDFNSILKDQKK